MRECDRGYFDETTVILPPPEDIRVDVIIIVIVVALAEAVVATLFSLTSPAFHCLFHLLIVTCLLRTTPVLSLPESSSSPPRPPPLHSIKASIPCWLFNIHPFNLILASFSFDTFIPTFTLLLSVNIHPVPAHCHGHCNGQQSGVLMINVLADRTSSSSMAASRGF